MLFFLTEWCNERNISTKLQEMTEEQLDENLRHFYAEARTATGQEYSKISLLSFRNAFERFLNENGQSVKLSKNPKFHKSNKMLDSKLKVNRKEGKDHGITHKPVITKEDLQKLKKSPAMSPNSPSTLLNAVWFYVVYHWCRRGREGQRELTRRSFSFATDASGAEYAYLTHEEASKNHPGGENSKPSEERQTRLYATGEEKDALTCLKQYIAKLNPECEAFFQRPRGKYSMEDPIWFENRPLGINKLSSMMKSISEQAGLSQIYTNHSVRATVITSLSDANIPTRQIMNVSGHVSEESLRSYSRRPTEDQLKRCSVVLSSGLEEENIAVPSTSSATIPKGSVDAASQQAHVSNSAFVSLNAFPSAIFQGCSIENVQINFSSTEGKN